MDRDRDQPVIKERLKVLMDALTKHVAVVAIKIVPGEPGEMPIEFCHEFGHRTQAIALDVVESIEQRRPPRYDGPAKAFGLDLPAKRFSGRIIIGLDLAASEAEKRVEAPRILRAIRDIIEDVLTQKPSPVS